MYIYNFHQNNMDWRIAFQLKRKEKNKKKVLEMECIEKISFYGKTRSEVLKVLDHYTIEEENDFLSAVLSETWYGKRKTIRLIFKENKVEEKYIKTEYGKLPITKL
ncbi:hypothetical protein SAMN02787073_2655 [Chryseobacterium vrystaatense]|uniref:Uncharacterized protein n=2 Tax=Chryseobacterium vrystaatense TaxID=307480 RepID=A0A1M5DMK0_9FLAO|nr:hypothetical protein SAMN02787073_2655 [Chryseobacterium vrystaatense]